MSHTQKHKKNTYWWCNYFWLCLIWWCNHCVYLLQESLPPAVQRPTLPCVWPMALSSSKRSEVNAWFNQRLQNYLVFLTKSLISPSSTYNASCLAFQKLYVLYGLHRTILYICLFSEKCIIFLDILSFFGCFQIRCLVSFCFSAFHFLVNTTTLLQTSWSEMCSTPSGLTSPQVSPHSNTDQE